MSRSQDAVVDDATTRRRASARQVRHAAHIQMQTMIRDEEALEESVLPVVCHDVGRHRSPKPHTSRHPETRGGFKVWKTPFWKRRTQLRAERNARERQLYEAE
ncbi:MAG: hypothetical protein QOK39_1923 [Acidimicrobiaceae bacterium]|jgi:hypothetical protein|nr:hypothetical protein [Acidimicrobiaceae bacterium]